MANAGESSVPSDLSSDARDHLAAILADHRLTGNWLNDTQLCRCGEWVVMGEYWRGDVGDPFAAHLAEALAPMLAAVKAEAWNEGYLAAAVVWPSLPPQHPSNPYRAEASDV